MVAGLPIVKMNPRHRNGNPSELKCSKFDHEHCHSAGDSRRCLLYPSRLFPPKSASIALFQSRFCYVENKCNRNGGAR